MVHEMKEKHKIIVCPDRTERTNEWANGMNSMCARVIIIYSLSALNVVCMLCYLRVLNVNQTIKKRHI